ncbi:hypothetical protein [Sorangium sp. So ce1153]|uniref:hypothetical protein n=1 Tax=Sorangium sp. So ce1153 TaxID=3133333 RepID=UPI003F62103D
MAIATRVFKATLPYHKIFITPIIGLQSRPFTSTVPPLLDLYILPIAYTVNIGWNGFRHGMDTVAPATLIHELTHVWQGAHRFIASQYMWESITHQAIGWLTSTDPYRYEPGHSWSSYNVEQQASIVEDWFKQGERTDDPLYRYIRDDIRSLLWFF